MAKILVVEDDELIGESIKDALSGVQHQVDIVTDGRQGLEYLLSIEYDVAILDWQLPTMEGVEICRQFRQKGGQTPVIMLTAKATIDDKEAGFDAGADDYLTKPFEIRELRARVKSLLRRPLSYAGELIVLGDLEIDSKNRTVQKAGKPVEIHATEFALLEFFVMHPNEIISPEALLRRVWSTDSDASLQAVYTCVKRVRQKIDPQNKEALIRTVYGMGYRLVPPEASI